MEVSIIGKMLQILKELAPNITRTALIYNPNNPPTAAFVRSFEAATAPLGIEPVVSRIQGLDDIERAVGAMAA